MKQHLLISLLVFLVSTNVHTQPKPKYMVDAIAFYQVTETQKTPVWCWAASIAMTLGAQGIKWKQVDVVLATKGQISIAGANELEMSAFLNSWNRFDHQGRTWSVESDYFVGAPPNEAIKRSLEAGRPMIITYRTRPGSQHAVVMYAANFPDDGDRLHSVYFFDPYTEKKGAATGAEFRENTTNGWDVRVWRR